MMESSLINNVEKLNTIPGLIKNISFFTSKIPKKQLLKFENVANEKLPENLGNFYTEKGQYSISWEYINPMNTNHKIFGDSTLLSPLQMIKSPDPRINFSTKPKYNGLLWNEGDDDNLIEYLQEFFILDVLGHDNFVLIKFIGEGELYLFTHEQKLGKLKLNIEQYIEKTFQARGMYLWQQYYTEKNQMPNLIKDNFHSNMEYLFSKTESDLFPLPDRPFYNFNINMLTSTKNYSNRFESMVYELRNNKNISNVELRMNQINTGAHPADFYRAFLSLGYEIPEFVVKFFQDVNGLQLRWQTKNAIGLDCDLTICSIQELFNGIDPTGVDWSLRRKWNYEATNYFGSLKDSDESLSQFVDWKLFYLEERCNTLLKFDSNGLITMSTVFDDEQYPLNIGFEEFIEKILEFRGAKYWQLSFCDIDKSEAKINDSFFEKFNLLFPK